MDSLIVHKTKRSVNKFSEDFGLNNLDGEGWKFLEADYKQTGFTRKLSSLLLERDGSFL